MKQRLSEILDKNIITLDSQKATVKDILFDSQYWIVQYLEVELGNFFSSNRILIPRALITNSRADNDLLHLSVTKSEIERCPKPEQDLPISRRYEEELNHHYDIPNYWGAYPVTGSILGYDQEIPPMSYQNKDQEFDQDIDETNLGTNLRSYNEIKGYSVIAADGNLGEIDDLVVNDETWQIVYAIIDTSKWIPWSKKVLLENQLINNISYKNREVHVNLHKDSIENAPDYDASKPIDDQYENIHRFYEKSYHH